MAEGAVEYFRDGPSFLSRYLPYWVVAHVQRLLAVMFTIIAITLPLHNYLPKLYGWVVHRYMRNLYRRLRVMDTELQTLLSKSQVGALQTELESIDRATSLLPMRHSDLFLSMKGNVSRARSELASRLAELAPAAPKAY